MATGKKGTEPPRNEKTTETATSSSGQAVRGASVLIILQVASRAVTFIANQLLVRFLTAQLLGISTQLEVYYLSVLFFARESLRVAIQRHGTGDESQKEDNAKGSSASARNTQAAVNLAYLSILIGLFVALLLGWLYLSSVGADISATPYLTQSLYLYAFASLIELLSEPAFVVMQVRLVFSARAAAEATATLLRCLVTLGTAVWAARSGRAIGVLPFAMGQLAYGTGLLLVYVWHGSALATAEGFSLFPRAAASASKEYILGLFYRPTLSLAASMTAQSLVKHVLTQGDTLLVSVLSTPTAQGVYALANNYGGLAARLLFQPVEESSRNYFSRLLAGNKPAIKGQESKDSGDKSAAVRASQDLSILFKAYVLLSLIITTLGPTAAPPLLALITGPRWASSGAGATLAAYMWYIPLLALNGVAEAFVASVASEAEVHTQSAWMLVFSLVFAGAGWVCLRVLEMGAIGLVLANCVNMACRIVWAVAFIKRWFTARGVDFDLGELRPSALGMGAAVVASQLVKTVMGDQDVSAAGVGAQVMSLVKVAGVAVPFVLIFAYSERQFLAQCFATARGKRAPS